MIQPLTAEIVYRLITTFTGTLIAGAALHPDLARDLGLIKGRYITLTPDPASFQTLDRDRSIAAWSLRYNPVPPTEANRTNAATMRVTASNGDEHRSILAIVSGTPSAPVLLALLPVDTVIPDPLPVD